MYSLRNRPEKLAKGSLFCLFLKLVQINFIFTDNVRILYISSTPHHEWDSVKRGGDVKLVLWSQPPLLLKWCGYANAFIIWVKQSNVHSANCVPYIFKTFKLCSQRNLCDFNCLIFIFIMMWILQDETMFLNTYS